MATNSYAIGALITQEDGGGVEQPMYYINRALKDAETRYPRAKKACLAIVYASQRLHHYFLTYEVWLMTKSHAIKTLLQEPILSGRISQWLLQLSQYDLRMGTPKAVKSQAIADLLAQFSRDEEFPLGDEVPREVAMAKEVVALSFKLEFPYLNNTAKYEAYLTGLAIALEMGVKHLRVLGDSNLVAYQTKGSFSLKEPNLTPYRAMAQKIEENFSTFEIEHAPRNENRFVDALATLRSQIMFKKDDTRVEVSKRKESIIKMLKEKFQEEHCEGDW
nr:retrovirus-related pol polyprotein from transposon 297 [Quercus suber]